MLVIEVDGSAHDTQKSCDAGRDQWLLVQYGVRTLRITNGEFIKTQHIAALHKINEARGVPKRHPIGDTQLNCLGTGAGINRLTVDRQRQETETQPIAPKILERKSSTTEVI